MSWDLAVSAIITNGGEILLGKKDSGGKLGNEWHFPGGDIEEGEEPEEAVRREIKEETGLDVEVHRTVDVTSQTYSQKFDGKIRVIFHCEAASRDTEAKDNLQQLKWVSPRDIMEEVDETERKTVENREEIQNLIRKLQEIPSFR